MVWDCVHCYKGPGPKAAADWPLHPGSWHQFVTPRTATDWDFIMGPSARLIGLAQLPPALSFNFNIVNGRDNQLGCLLWDYGEMDNGQNGVSLSSVFSLPLTPQIWESRLNRRKWSSKREWIKCRQNVLCCTKNGRWYFTNIINQINYSRERDTSGHKKLR